MTIHQQSNAILRDGTIAQHSTLGGGYCELILHCPEVAKIFSPGQFVHLRVPGLRDRLLRRPFSIFKSEDGYLVMIYKRVGIGTELLAQAAVDQKVSILGPLGNGFPYPQAGAIPVLVGGGYGAAALYATARASAKKGVVFLGGRNREDVLCVSDFQTLGWDVEIATEDGSYGRRGLVTDSLDDWMRTADPDAQLEMFACGPHGMLKAVGARAMARGCKGWLSMDRPMGCGIGACLACVQKIKNGNGGWEYVRICKDGPVFECRDICWDEPEGDL